MESDDIANTLKQADEEVLDEILREAEARLQAQLQTAIASDLRAMTFLGFLLTIVAFSIGTAITSVANREGSLATAIVASVAAVGFLLASYHAFQGSKPIDFEFVGNDPESWLSDVEKRKKLAIAKAEQCAYYDTMLKANRTAMRRASEALVRSGTTAMKTLAICGVLVLAKVFLPIPF